ncbi:MAG: tetratricopeptide repeat protein [Bryobacteraceae bacterium]
MWRAAATLWLALAQQPDAAQQGLKALEENRYEEAAAWFARAVQSDPNDYGALFHLALAESLLGKDEEAIAGYKRVLELKPGLYEAELNLGILLLRRKRADEAIPHLESAVRQKPEAARARLHLGLALLETGRYEQAQQALQEAVKLEPGSALAHLGLARALARRDRIEEAAPHFRKAAELDASFQDALAELAALYEAKGKREEAIALYARFPENPGARERLGQLLLEAGHPQEAIPHLEWAVTHSPTRANRTALAIAYSRSGQPDKALEQMRQAIATAPDDPELHLLYGRLLRDQKRFAEAAGEFHRYAQARPDSLEGWNELAAMLVSLGQHTEALKALDRVRALGGETAGHHYLRAIVLDKMRDYKGALAAYQAFLAASQGKFPDEEFKARQRVRIIQKELERR